MHPSIRRLTVNDLLPAMDMVLRVFMEFEAPDYSKEGIREFQKFADIENIQTLLEAGDMLLWGYFEAENPVGIIAVAPAGHIRLLFVDKAYHRRGIAKALHQTAEQNFLNRGIQTITVNSSPYAVGVYRRMGYMTIRDEQTANGIRYTPMLKGLGEMKDD